VVADAAVAPVGRDAEFASHAATATVAARATASVMARAVGVALGEVAVITAGLAARVKV
jgi:hypothetical protein